MGESGSVGFFSEIGGEFSESKSVRIWMCPPTVGSEIRLSPVDMVNIPLFTGFHTCQVVQDAPFFFLWSKQWTAKWVVEADFLGRNFQMKTARIRKLKHRVQRLLHQAT